jgi:hypothetical protein
MHENGTLLKLNLGPETHRKSAHPDFLKATMGDSPHNAGDSVGRGTGE